jgi:hypothetical protein
MPRLLIRVFVSFSLVISMFVLLPRLSPPRYPLGRDILAEKESALRAAKAQWRTLAVSSYRVRVSHNGNGNLSTLCQLSYDVEDEKIVAVNSQPCPYAYLLPLPQPMSQLFETLSMDLYAAQWLNGNCNVLIPDLTFDAETGHPVVIIYRLTAFRPEVVGWAAYWRYMPHAAVSEYHADFGQRNCTANGLFGPDYTLEIRFEE